MNKTTKLYKVNIILIHRECIVHVLAFHWSVNASQKACHWNISFRVESEPDLELIRNHHYPGPDGKMYSCHPPHYGDSFKKVFVLLKGGVLYYQGHDVYSPYFRTAWLFLDRCSSFSMKISYWRCNVGNVSNLTCKHPMCSWSLVLVIAPFKARERQGSGMPMHSPP
jgi:hypothetical protein